MTWAPRSRTDEEGNVYNSDHEGEDGDKREDEEEIDLENIDTENIENKDDLDEQDELHSDLKLDGRSDSEISDGYEDLQGPEQRLFKAMVKDGKEIHGDRAEHFHHHSHHHHHHHHNHNNNNLEQANSEPVKLNQAIINSPPSENNPPPAPKPKIWSLAETATTPDNPRKSPLMNGTSAASAAQTIITPHRLLSCPVGKIQSWTNRGFTAHQLALLNSNHYLGLSNQASANGLALYSRQAEDRSQNSESTVTERSSALEAEKKLLKTAFHPVQRR